MAGLDVAAGSVKPYPNVEDRKTGCSMIESFLKTEFFIHNLFYLRSSALIRICFFTFSFFCR